MDTATPGASVMDLPPVEDLTPYEEVLANRASVREFTTTPLTIEEIGRLMWAAQGVTRAWGGRTAPSAGALYPLELYAASAEGLYHYLPEGHKVELGQEADLRAQLARAALDQAAVAEAPVVFVLAAVPERTSAKYGDRAQRYVILEAGHACQNLLLEATALGLGAVPIGAFHDDDVKRILGLGPEEEPLYLVPVGHPRS